MHVGNVQPLSRQTIPTFGHGLCCVDDDVFALVLFLNAVGVPLLHVPVLPRLDCSGLVLVGLALSYTTNGASGARRCPFSGTPGPAL